MGSPLGYILVDIFMTNPERTKIKGAIDEMVCYSRYVDDIYMVCSNQQHATKVLKRYSEAHKNIQFTMEHKNETSSIFSKSQ